MCLVDLLGQEGGIQGARRYQDRVGFWFEELPCQAGVVGPCGGGVETDSPADISPLFGKPPEEFVGPGEGVRPVRGVGGGGDAPNFGVLRDVVYQGSDFGRVGGNDPKEIIVQSRELLGARGRRNQRDLEGVGLDLGRQGYAAGHVSDDYPGPVFDELLVRSKRGDRVVPVVSDDELYPLSL